MLNFCHYTLSTWGKCVNQDKENGKDQEELKMHWGVRKSCGIPVSDTGLLCDAGSFGFCASVVKWRRRAALHLLKFHDFKDLKWEKSKAFPPTLRLSSVPVRKVVPQVDDRKWQTLVPGITDLFFFSFLEQLIYWWFS